MPKRIIVPLAGPPRLELLFEIGGRLARKRGIAGVAFAILGVTGRASGKTASGIAKLVQSLAPAGGGAGEGRGRYGKSSIIGRDLRAIAVIEAERDRAHQKMLAPAIGIIVDLAVEIAGIEPGKARGVLPVAFAAQAVAGKARGLGAGIAAAHRDRLARRAEAIMIGGRVAGREWKQEEKRSGAHLAGTNAAMRWFPKRGAGT